MRIPISVLVEGFAGLTWPLWKAWVAEIEPLGYTALDQSDHFGAEGWDTIELVVALGYAADHLQHIPFGSMVAPFSFRDPVMLARQAVALDNLSGGGMILGLGSGWNQSEHDMFGYKLGDMSTRMDRFAEGLAVVSSLIHSDEPVSYQGKFYQLQNAILLPRPERAGGTRIMVGGKGPKRVMPLVARYADIWNANQLTPDEFRQRSAMLDTLLQQEGRQPTAVKRTFAAFVYCGQTPEELEPRIAWWRKANPAFASLSTEELVPNLCRFGLFGTPEQIAAHIRTYAEAGAEEFVVQWGPTDLEGLRLFAEQVLRLLA